MPTDHRTALRSIRTFPALVGYLRDEMDWPIESDDFEEMTFDETPEDLGIDPRNAAKIQGIKRLRPFTSDQPWGIFFVNFEPRRLPVVALRRILFGVALKKRTSANSDERPAWQKDDLLFISNYGEGNQRQISFAHFAQTPGKADLTTLKVLGWDDRDTALHLDDVADTLTRQLAWPQDESNLDVWRNQWRSAFTLGHREVITTSQALSVRLAALARRIRIQIQDTLPIENERGPLTRLLKAFQQALLHDLDNDGFADMYAQTIAYGLLAARVENPKAKTADALPAQMPVTNPFLKELMATFLHAGGRHGQAGGPGIDFDELGISDVVALLDTANMEAVVKDFGDRNRDEDPVIHFYEVFLTEYDAKKRMQRGVFYTPHPVVSYIVRSVHELLQTEFGLEDGLASTVTWGEMMSRHPDLKLPTIERLNPNKSKPEVVTIPEQTPFVQILDPATGTATFLAEVIDVIYRTLTAKWKAQRLTDKQQLAAWNEYVPKHLLPRLYGYELMMAPYAIAHMKIGLKLQETGYRFQSEERVRVYLTNALEPATDAAKQQQFEALVPALAHEAQAVNEVKRNQRFTVVIGNPPYSVNSFNESYDETGKATFIGSLIADYRQVDGNPLGERNPKVLQDDYVKFIRFSQWKISQTQSGIIGFITNHSYLDNLTFRGMRQSLINTFSNIFVCDLHGNSKKKEIAPEKIQDDNVFDIQQGTALFFAIKNNSKIPFENIYHSELWGIRLSKYDLLSRISIRSSKWIKISPKKSNYLFIPQETMLLSEYERGMGFLSIFSINSSCMNTARDALVIDIDRQKLINRMKYIINYTGSIEHLENALNIKSTDWWSFEEAIKNLKNTHDLEKLVIKCLYRPFDSRWLFYHLSFIDRPRTQVNQYIVNNNISIVTTRQTKEPFAAIATNLICGQHKIAAVYDRSYFFPLYLNSAYDKSLSSFNRESNFSRIFLNKLCCYLNQPQDESNKLPKDITPEGIFHYIYSILHSPNYRTRYAEFLKIDFPRLPLTSSLDLFRTLSELGGELVALHLMESTKLDQHLTTYTGNAAPIVDKAVWNNNTVWFDKKQSCGFIGVPENVWNFHIGGYQVCNKWLKDRKGRALSSDDLNHYQRVVVALSETIRLMAEIDQVIEQYGGWLGAFSTITEELS